ncbi:MAG: hypothetical protein A2X86_20260 [Bdellovibrionales bacterium GWA2_49_15]|nr:MAG: hypothetical protein A2X86_20260 [Bdellovibrionales bacterium GWA2_49_15]HAZ11353.1 hypothetical protein [Bdellovibrionales bacterium]
MKRFFFFLLLLVTASLSVWANGPSECAPERSQFCVAADANGDLAVYVCLENHLKDLGHNCREAVLRANPVLREQLEVQAVCQKEAPLLCSNGMAKLNLISCLENNYKQLGSECLAKLTATNPSLRAQIKRDSEAAKKKHEEELAEIERKKKEEEKKQADELLKIQHKLAQERHQQRYKDCQSRLRKAYPDDQSATYFYYCERYAKIPVLSPEQGRCMDGLIQARPAKYTSKAQDKMQNELDAWQYCKDQTGDSSFLTCTKTRLKDGDDFTMAGNSCLPLHQRCLAHLTGGKKTSDPTYGNFLYAICSSFQSYYMTVDECTDKEAPYWMSFYQQPKDGHLVQQHLREKHAECLSFFEKTNGYMDCIKEFNNSDHRLRQPRFAPILVKLCKESPIYRKCVLKKFFQLPQYIQVLGYPSTQREQEAIHRTCTLEETLKSPPSSPTASEDCECTK